MLRRATAASLLIPALAGCGPLSVVAQVFSLQPASNFGTRTPAPAKVSGRVAEASAEPLPSPSRGPATTPTPAVEATSTPDPSPESTLEPAAAHGVAHVPGSARYTTARDFARAWALAWRWTGTEEPPAGVVGSCDYGRYDVRAMDADTIAWELPDDCGLVFRETLDVRVEGEDAFLVGWRDAGTRRAGGDFMAIDGREPVAYKVRWDASTEHLVGTRMVGKDPVEPFWMAPLEADCKPLLCK